VRRLLGTALVTAIVGFALYLPSLGYGFVWDDRSLIRDNRYLHDLGGWRRNVSSDFFLRSNSPERIGHWRPAVTMTYMIDHAVGGGGPRAFHVRNAVLHGVACGLLVLLASSLGLGIGAALGAGLLFAAHPVHVESVAWISGRTDLLCGVFVLAALVLDARGAGRPGRGWRLGSACATLVALLSKEMAVVVPVAVALRAGLFPGPGGDKPARSAWRAAAPHVAAIGLYALVRFAVLGIAPKSSDAALQGHAALFATWWSAFLDYMRVLVWPATLSIVPPVSLSASPAIPRVIAGAAVFAALAAAAWRWRRERPVLAWSLGCFLASFAPLTNFIVAVRAPSGVEFPWAERFLFVPSIFAAIAAACALAGARRRLAVGRIAAAVVVVAALGARALARETVWRDQRTLMEAAVREAPMDAASLASLGGELADLGDEAAAERHLMRAVEIAPNNSIARFNLGNLLRERGDLAGAEREYRAALAARPRYPQAWLNLGLVQATRRRWQEAEGAFRRADEAMGGYPEAKLNLANTLRAMGRPQEAIPVFEDALTLAPELDAARAGLEAARRETSALPPP